MRDISRGVLLASACRKAESFGARLLGLMGRKSFPSGCDALLFEECSSIHCFFMRMEIDVLFLDREGRVVRSFSRLKPWRLAFGGGGARRVIELPAGTIRRTGIRPGHRVAAE